MIPVYAWVYSILVSFFIGLSPSPAYQQVNPSDTYHVECEVQNTVFQSGEEITYSMYYHLTPFWIKAGEVTFTIHDLDSIYRIVAEGRTASSFEWFYKVRDVYTCDIDKQSLRPLRSSRDIHEGSYRKFSNAEYDFDKQRIIAHTGKSPDQMKRIEVQMDHCMHDILSVIYYARNLNFDRMKVGDLVPTNIFMDDDKYPIGFFYDGVESDKKIKKLGRTETIVLRPQLIGGYVFEDDTEMTIWASNDKNKLPLLIESPVSVGSVKAVLDSYKNLRYDMKFE